MHGLKSLVFLSFSDPLGRDKKASPAVLLGCLLFVSGSLDLEARARVQASKEVSTDLLPLTFGS